MEETFPPSLLNSLEFKTQESLEHQFLKFIIKLFERKKMKDAINVSGSKIESNTSGFENIGRFYKYIRSDKFKHLTNNHRAIYLLFVEYSFGYTKNIKYELQISNKTISKELGISKPTIIKAINDLVALALITRIKWQHYGPKQIYKYKVNFPSGYHISHKQTTQENKEQEFNENNQKLQNLL